MKNPLTLKDLYSFPGFRARIKLKPHPEDPDARIVTLRRRQKKTSAPVVAGLGLAVMIVKFTMSGTWPAAARECILSSNTAGSIAAVAMP
jgi:hypothetical protein